MTVYEVLQRALMSAVAAGDVTGPQAAIASAWLDVHEAVDGA